MTGFYRVAGIQIEATDHVTHKANSNLLTYIKGLSAVNLFTHQCAGYIPRRFDKNHLDIILPANRTEHIVCSF